MQQTPTSAQPRAVTTPAPPSLHSTPWLSLSRALTLLQQMMQLVHLRCPHRELLPPNCQSMRQRRTRTAPRPKSSLAPPLLLLLLLPLSLPQLLLLPPRRRKSVAAWVHT